jgi:hypothetical protein
MTKQIAVKKEAPWYFGGIASIGAVMFTHPLGIFYFISKYKLIQWSFFNYFTLY